MLDIKWPFSTHMDFPGQKKAERIFQVIIIVFGIIGFIIGYIMQQFSLTIYTVFLGVLVSALVALPPWPAFRKHPIEWQPSSDSPKPTTTSNKNTSSTKSPKKDNQKPKVKKDQ